jgi:hypothetical protein
MEDIRHLKDEINCSMQISIQEKINLEEEVQQLRLKDVENSRSYEEMEN